MDEHSSDDGAMRGFEDLLRPENRERLDRMNAEMDERVRRTLERALITPQHTATHRYREHKTGQDKPKVYLNECAECGELGSMRVRHDVPAQVWLNYCPECIDKGAPTGE